MQPSSAPGRSLAQIAGHNSRTVLEALRRSGPLSRNDLANLVGLTIPGVTNVTRRLFDEGLIAEQRLKPANAQIPAVHYVLNPDGAFAIGARSRNGRTEAVLIDLAGKIRQRTEAASLDLAVEELSRKHSVIGVGLAAELPVEGALSEQSTVTAILAETMLGAGTTDAGLVLVLIEDKVRAGLFFQGRPFAGVNGRAGRLGDMRTGQDRRPLDEVLAVPSYEAATDRPAWVANAARHLVDALFAMTGFVAPGRIVIGGDLPAAVTAALIDEVRRLALARDAEANALALPEIRSATHGSDAVILGAALLPLFEKLLPDPRK